jgi:hypothetical protein
MAGHTGHRGGDSKDCWDCWPYLNSRKRKVKMVKVMIRIASQTSLRCRDKSSMPGFDVGAPFVENGMNAAGGLFLCDARADCGQPGRHLRAPTPPLRRPGSRASFELAVSGIRHPRCCTASFCCELIESPVSAMLSAAEASQLAGSARKRMPGRVSLHEQLARQPDRRGNRARVVGREVCLSRAAAREGSQQGPAEGTA